MSSLPSVTSAIAKTHFNTNITTGVGLTYPEFKSLVMKLANPGASGRPWFTVVNPAQLMSILYASVRIHGHYGWEPFTHYFSSADATPNYQIRLNKEIFAVMPNSVEVVRGLIHHQIAAGVDAEALFNGIEQAQDIFAENAKEVEFAEPTTEGLDVALGADEADQDALVDIGTVRAKGHSTTQNAIAEAETRYTEPQKSKKKPAFGMNNDEVVSHFKSLQGRVLTILEASTPDKSQREALKTVVSKEFRHQLERVWRRFLHPDMEEGSTDD